MIRFRRHIVPRADGTFAIRLGQQERSILATLPRLVDAQVEADPDDPWLQRLFPTAYPKDPEREQEWQLLMSLDLHAKRRAQLQGLAATSDATTLTEEELSIWVQAINDIRLYIGTRLEVSEETEDDDFDDEDDRYLYAIYQVLAYLQEEAVEALSEALPDVGEGATAPQDDEG